MVRDALREADTLSAVASRHGIHPNQGRGWRRLFLEGGQAALRSGAKQASEHEATIRDLHTKIDELVMERGFLPSIGQMSHAERSASPRRTPWA